MLKALNPKAIMETAQRQMHLVFLLVQQAPHLSQNITHHNEALGFHVLEYPGGLIHPCVSYLKSVQVAC